MSDEIELGESNLVPLPDGWFKNIKTGATIDPSGVVYSKEGEVLYDPNDDSEEDTSIKE